MKNTTKPILVVRVPIMDDYEGLKTMRNSIVTSCPDYNVIVCDHNLDFEVLNGGEVEELLTNSNLLG